VPDASPYETIRLEVDGHVATLTLDRPESGNATTVGMIAEIVHAIDALDADDGVRCVVVTGAGRHFCTGADLSKGDDTYAFRRWDGDDGGLREGKGGAATLALRIHDSPKPFVAAINGSAVGVGLTLTLPMDVRLCAETSKLGLLFSKRGMVIDGASSWFLPRIVSMTWATDWAYSGRLFTPDEAQRAGLVRDVLPAAEVLPAAQALAAEIAEANPVSVSLAKALLWRAGMEPTPHHAAALDTAALAELGHRPDAAEGVRSFLEKRPAEWVGRVSADMPAGYPWW
jgi:enoyl-CoA hydratase/carnithine racemase